MILSDVAIVDLRLQQRALVARLTALMHWPRREPVTMLASAFTRTSSSSSAPPATAPVEIRIMPPPQDEEPHFRWRRHPRLRAITAKRARLEPAELSARQAAIRGLMLARSHDYAGAQAAFTEAARYPHLDLTSIPTFWQLTRAGQDAAIQAYQDAGRERDALVLATALDNAFRPRALPALPSDDTPTPPDSEPVPAAPGAIASPAEHDPGPPQGEPGIAVRGRARP